MSHTNSICIAASHSGEIAFIWNMINWCAQIIYALLYLNTAILRQQKTKKLCSHAPALSLCLSNQYVYLHKSHDRNINFPYLIFPYENTTTKRKCYRKITSMFWCNQFTNISLIRINQSCSCGVYITQSLLRRDSTITVCNIFQPVIDTNWCLILEQPRVILHPLVNKHSTSSPE